MNKLRTDSVFSQLTPEQVETLEGWLFEENLGYKEALERVEKEFNVKGSLSGLRRFYRRLAMERSREDLVEMANMCADALATAKTDGTLQAGLLTLGYKCAMELLVQSPGKVREFTALLRALTSAQALEMKRVEFQRGEDERKAQALKKQKDEEREREWQRKQNEENEARWKAREEKRKAKAAATESSKDQAPSTRETASPKLQIVEEKLGLPAASVKTLGAQAAAKPLSQTEGVSSAADNSAGAAPGNDKTDGTDKVEDKMGGGAETPRVAA